MNHTVQKTVRNVSSRLVTIRCNSGDYCHLAPDVSVDLDAVETDKNKMLSRLKDSGLITIKDAEKKKSKRKTAKRASKKAASKKSSSSKKKKTAAIRKKSG